MNHGMTFGRQFAIPAMFAVGVGLGFGGLWLSNNYLNLEAPSRKLMSVILIAFCGGSGGILFAMRNAILHLPRRRSDGKLDAGLLADCCYGVAGAFVIFLVTPGMSEAIPGMTANAAKGTANVSSNGIDWIEVIAVALVGGYAGRALMDRAVETLAQVDEKVESTRTELVECKRNLEDKIEDLSQKHQSDTEALALIYQQFNLERTPPTEEQLKIAVANASHEIRSRILHETRDLLASNLKSYAARTIPVLLAVTEADLEEKLHASRALLAWAYESEGNWLEAKHWIELAIESRDANRVPGFRHYEEFLARSWIELCPNFAQGTESAEDVNELVYENLRKAYPQDHAFEHVTDLEIRRWLSLNREPASASEQGPRRLISVPAK